MDMQTFNLIFYLSMGAILVPIVILFSRISRQPPEYKWLAICLLFSFSCDFLNEVQYNFFKFPVNILGNFYVVVSPILLTFFFYYCLGWKSFRMPFVIFNIVYFLFSVANFAFVQKITINTYSAIIEKLLIMLLSILYFYKVIKELPAEKIYHIGLFWIISALFIINSAKLVLYSFAHYLVVFKDNLMFLWSLHNILSIVSSFGIAFGVVIHYRSRKLKQTT
jgi:hypothetical protein